MANEAFSLKSASVQWAGWATVTYGRVGKLKTRDVGKRKKFFRRFAPNFAHPGLKPCRRPCLQPDYAKYFCLYGGLQYWLFGSSGPGPPGIPVLKVENSPPASCKNSRKFPLSNTPLYTLSANINLTKTDHLSIAMSNVNIVF